MGVDRGGQHVPMPVKALAFCLFANDVALPTGKTPLTAGRHLGELAEIIHQHAP